MIRPFGDWRPDIAALNAVDQSGQIILAEARNVYADDKGYIPIPGLAQYQTGTGLPATCVGAFAGRSSSTGAYSIFAGTATKLYKYNSATSNWDDYTRAVGGNYNVPSGDFWSFTQFGGGKVIAVNINDNPQTIDLDTGATAFSDLGGTPPKARYVGVVNNFVFLACLSTNDRMIMNSAINSTTGWTVGTNLCDQVEFVDGDKVTGFSGGEFGWVMQQHAIRRAIFQPGYDQAFRFERVERSKGALGPYSSVGVRDTVFFRADDGFYSLGPQGLVPIGHMNINDWFVANTDPARQANIVGVQDVQGPRVMWACYQNANSSTLDRLVIYDWDRQKFTYSDAAAQFWAKLVTPATTLEGLNVYGTLEAVPASLDDAAWLGGGEVLGGIGANGKIYLLNGAVPQTALLRTTPMQINPTGRADVTDIEPLGVFNDASLAVRVGRRENTRAMTNYTVSLTPSTNTGVARTHAAGRIHEIELTVSQSSGTAWMHVQGVDLMAVPDGEQ